VLEQRRGARLAGLAVSCGKLAHTRQLCSRGAR
jgi:hypothetical protein